MNDKIRAQIVRNRHHQKNANGLELLDLEYLHELFGRNADTMERLLAVYEAAVTARTVDSFGLLSVEKGWRLDEAIAAVKRNDE